MKTRQPSFTSVLLTLFVTVAAGGLAHAVPLSGAAVKTVVLTGAASGLPAGTNTTPEAVDLTGQARIITTPYIGDATNPPGVLIDIEVFNVKGKGRSSNQLYVGTGQDRSILSMPLATSEQIELDFLFYPAGHASLADRSKVNHTPSHGSFTLTLDTAGGFQGAAAAPVVTPRYPQ